jgi:hypothetical protein
VTLPRAFDQTSRRFRTDLRKHGCVVFSGLLALDIAGFPVPKDTDRAAWDLFQRSGESLAGFRKDGLSLDQLATAIKATPSGDRLPWRIQRHRGVKVATTLRDQLRERVLSHAEAMAMLRERVTDVEHQRPHPVADRAAYLLHPRDRRHIETETVDGRIVRREWWWEPDREPCDPESRREPLP